MFTFRFLKVVNLAVDAWFHVQIQESHLPHAALPAGKIAETTTGLRGNKPASARHVLDDDS